MRNKTSSRSIMWGLGTISLVILALAFAFALKASAATAPGLGTTASYAVLAGSTVTNTGASTIEGNVGVSPGSAVTGFPPGIVTNGAIHAADANALQAQNDLTNTYNVLAGDACDVNLTGQDLGGKTLTTGVYCFSTSAQLTGQLTLDAQGSSAAVFIFQIGSTLTTASNASILVTNGGIACNAYWQVGSSATLGVGTTFVGNIVALTSISLNTAASISGRALARNGAVTLDTNQIGFAACAPATGTPTPTASPVPTGTPTATASPVPTGTPTATPTVVPTASPTTPATASPTAIPTDTPIGQTPSPTPAPPTDTPIPTPTPVGQTPTPTLVLTPTPTPVLTLTSTPALTPTPTPTRAATPTPTATSTSTPAPTPTSVVRSSTATPSATPATPTPRGALPPQAPTNTPSPTPGITHFPNTGGPPGETGLPWLPLLLGLALISFGAAAVALSYRTSPLSPKRIDR